MAAWTYCTILIFSYQFSIIEETVLCCKVSADATCNSRTHLKVFPPWVTVAVSINFLFWFWLWTEIVPFFSVLVSLCHYTSPKNVMQRGCGNFLAEDIVYSIMTLYWYGIMILYCTSRSLKQPNADSYNYSPLVCAVGLHRYQDVPTRLALHSPFSDWRSEIPDSFL